MSPKLLVTSGEDPVGALEEFGYVRVRQKGSHVRFGHSADAVRLRVLVPLHHEIAFGRIRRILRESKIATEELNSVL